VNQSLPLSRGFPVWRDLWTASDELTRLADKLNEAANGLDMDDESGGRVAAYTTRIREHRDECNRLAGELNGAASLLGAPYYMIELPLTKPGGTK
jgi:hypothetical protein